MAPGVVRRLAVFLLVLNLNGGAAAAEREIWSPEWREWRVRVRVAATAAIQEQVESYFRREVRSLGDVVLVERYPDLEVSVVAILTRSPEGEPTGISFSVVFLERFDNRPLVEWLEFLARGQEPGQAEVLRTLAAETAGLGKVLAHRMKVGPPDAVRLIAEEMVIEFDRDHLEPRRRAHAEAVEVRAPPPAHPLPEDLYLPVEPFTPAEIELELREPEPEVEPAVEPESKSPPVVPEPPA